MMPSQLSLTLHDLGTRPLITRDAFPGMDRLAWREVDMEAKTFDRRVHDINSDLAVLDRLKLQPWPERIPSLPTSVRHEDPSQLL